MLAWEGRGPVQPRDMGLGGSPGRGKIRAQHRVLACPHAVLTFFFFSFLRCFSTELKAGVGGNMPLEVSKQRSWMSTGRMGPPDWPCGVIGGLQWDSAPTG